MTQPKLKALIAAGIATLAVTTYAQRLPPSVPATNPATSGTVTVTNPVKTTEAFARTPVSICISTGDPRCGEYVVPGDKLLIIETISFRAFCSIELPGRQSRRSYSAYSRVIPSIF